MDKYRWSDPPSQVAFPIARAGYPIIFAAAFITAVFALLDITWLTLLALCVTLFICAFFRDPDRIIPQKEGALVSPADGRIIFAGPVERTPFYEGECLKVSVFMTVFNVHVNRVPYDGKIERVAYYPGKFLSANLDKASRENEHNAIYMETENGQRISFVQIAGLVARRIICKVRDGDRVSRGQRFGIICFGSRVDMYLPGTCRLNVSVGEKVLAGNSIVGFLE